MARFTYTWETIFSHKNGCRTAGSLGTWRGLAAVLPVHTGVYKKPAVLAAAGDS